MKIEVEYAITGYGYCSVWVDNPDDLLSEFSHNNSFKELLEGCTWEESEIIDFTEVNDDDEEDE